MAEASLSREDARRQAETLLGPEAKVLRLPESDRSVIRLALATVGKWRVAVHFSGKVKLLGFDLGEIDVAARWMGLTPDPALLDGIGIIERAALRVLEAK